MNYQSLLLVWVLIVGQLTMTSCGKKSAPSEKPTQSCSGSAIPDAPPSAGQLVLELPADIDPCSVQGYVVGYREQLKLANGTNGRYFIQNVPSGEHDVIITAGTLAVSLTGDRSQNRGRRLKKIKFLNGQKTESNEIDLPVLGSISGSAKLLDKSDHAGIEVYIPGTDLIAKTDTSGAFSISGIPVGEHNLYFEKDGYHRGQIESVVVDSDATKRLDDVELVVSTGAEGFILIENGATRVNSRKVRLNIGATTDATLMKVSEDITFQNKSWIPINSTITYTFDSEGSKSLYAVFADANGLQSSPFSASTVVDVFENTQDKVAISPADLARYELDLGIPLNGKEMALSLDSEEFGAWIPSISPYTIEISKICGPRTLHLKFRDADGFQSAIFSKNFEVKCFEDINFANKSALLASLQGPNVAFNETQNIVLFWGGRIGMGYTNKGVIYNLSTNSTREMNTTGAPDPILYGTATASEGDYFLVWGGDEMGNSSGTNKGYLYSISSNSWTAVPTTNAPSARFSSAHKIIAIGNRFIVWGGFAANGSPTNDGGILDPTSGWTLVNGSGAPSARIDFGMIRAGAKVIIWGGRSFNTTNATHFNDGAILDPVTNSWEPINSSNAPSPRANPSIVWTGSKLFVCGGFRYESGAIVYPNDCGLYDPSTQTWLVSTMSNASTYMAAGMAGNRIALLTNVNGTATSIGRAYTLDGLVGNVPSGGPIFVSNYNPITVGSKLLLLGFAPPNFNSGAVFGQFFNPWP